MCSFLLNRTVAYFEKASVYCSTFTEMKIKELFYFTGFRFLLEVPEFLCKSYLKNAFFLILNIFFYTAFNLTEITWLISASIMLRSELKCLLFDT